jgi:hypothetical protein
MADDDAKKPLDVVLLHSPTDDGQGARVLRVRDDSLSVGEVRPVVEGQPLNDREVVRLKPREGAPRVCDVETLYEPPAPKREGHGPAKVATKQFREGWEAIFGERAAKDEALN